MYNSPFVSVIIPVYNSKKYISEAIFSLLNQPIKNLEIILVDDGSTDGSSKICDTFAEKYDNISVIHQQNSGVSVARNSGIRKAKGEFLAFLDSDDLWCKNFFDNDLYEYLLNTDSDLISFDIIHAADDLSGCLKQSNGCAEQQKDKFDILKSNMYFSLYLYRRNAIKDLFFSEGIKYNEDIEFIFKAFKVINKASKYDKYMYIYRSNPLSFMHSMTNPLKSIIETIKLWEKNINELQSSFFDKTDDLDNFVAFCVTRQVEQAFAYIDKATLMRIPIENTLADLSDVMDIDRLKISDGLFAHTLQIQKEFFQDQIAFVKNRNKKYILNKVKLCFKNSSLIKTIYSKKERSLYTESIDSFL